MNADRTASGYADTPDDIRERMTDFYRGCFEADVAPLVEAGELTPEEAARAVDMALSQWFVQGLIESCVARGTGGLH